MATITASIAETVAGMQRVLNRDDYSSDSDEPYLRPSNHFNKLKRKSHFIARDSGARVNGAQRGGKSVRHAGYSRNILRRNPRRYDEDGDELGSEDEDEAADERAAAENPYSEIHLETLLAPLTAVEDLPNHPSLSTIYESSTLSDMAQHACEVLERERKTLANAKRLMTRLRGDETWIPAGRMKKAYDQEIFDTSRVYTLITSKAPGRQPDTYPSEGLEAASKAENPAISLASTNNLSPHASQARDRRQPETSIKPEHEGVMTLSEASRQSLPNPGPAQSTDTAQNASDEDRGSVDQIVNAPDNDILPSVEAGPAPDETADIDMEEAMEDIAEGSVSPPRRVTRAQAQADKLPASSRSESPKDWETPQLHPLFLLPPETKPDADLGLPSHEAVETRQLLGLYVQKQEEVCRGAERLYAGLLHADQQRKEVFRWCKAEGHVGEMSDGEDWYDKEEWGLDGDLTKGHAEEEEDTVVQGKKTRGRRA